MFYNDIVSASMRNSLAVCLILHFSLTAIFFLTCFSLAEKLQAAKLQAAKLQAEKQPVASLISFCIFHCLLYHFGKAVACYLQILK